MARRFAGSYKNDTPSKQTPAQREARARIVEGLAIAQFQDVFGFRLELAADTVPRLLDDPGADQLDAVLCAVQAGWSWTRRESNFGLPRDADPLEGWIADPGLSPSAIPQAE